VSEPPASLAELWDHLCDRFEDEWKSGNRPLIEEFLGAMPESGRPALFRELLGLELAYRGALGEQPPRDEFNARFPGFAGIVRTAFDTTRAGADFPSQVRCGSAQAGAELLSGAPSRWLDLVGPRIFSRMMGEDQSTALDEPAPREPVARDEPDGGDRPRRFRVLRPHARGGLGAVFVAHDVELNREVALKQIQDRFASDLASRARFLAEAVITGNLEHPGVVPVYALGWNGQRPYYAMRLIRGESLKEAIERLHRQGTNGTEPGERSLELRKLLARFVTVCNAVAYAHDRGVVHRDLKPANIMLGLYGETLVVDWGLATPSRNAEVASQPSAPSSPIGTPAYMSPEQAAGTMDRVGPACDVYSLGATLYCLLTGRAPFEGEADSVLRAVEQGAFPRPRGVNPSVDNGLEAVCLKAMAWRPEDRYETARALGEDIERWSADEPVSARRDPVAQRARRWARRHRTWVGVGAAMLVAGIVGLTIVTALQAGANAALKRANRATEAALTAARAAERRTAAALAQSDESRKQAMAVGDFVVGALASPDPAVDGRDVKVADVLDQAARALEKGFQGSKATEGALLDALGRSYHGLGLYTQSAAMHRQARNVRAAALGPSHRETLMSADRLGDALWSGGRRDEGEALHLDTLERRRRLFGPDDLDTLQSRATLAMAHAYTGRGGEAVDTMRDVVAAREAKLGADHPDTLLGRNGLAIAYQLAGRYADAVASFDEVVKRRAVRLGPDHIDTLQSRFGLARAHEHAGHLDTAAAQLDALRRQFDAKLGSNHGFTLATQAELGTVYRLLGKLDRAIVLLELTVARSEAGRAPGHPETLAFRNNLALAYKAARRYREAIPLYEQNLRRYETTLGPDHPDTMQARNNLAVAYRDVGRYADAAPLLEDTLRRRETKLGADHPHTLESRANLAVLYQESGRLVEALSLHRTALRQYEVRLGPDQLATLAERRNLADALVLCGRTAEAEPLLRDNLARRRKANAPDKRALSSDLAALARVLRRQSQWSDVVSLLRESLAIKEKVAPDDWSRFEVMSHLGEALWHQGEFAAAEPLIVTGYEGMKSRELAIRRPEQARLDQAAGRVVRFYQAWGKPERAAEWRSRIGTPELPADVFAPVKP
jgi:tetratricopeptide (TPR) repeat protein